MNKYISNLSPVLATTFAESSNALELVRTADTTKGTFSGSNLHFTLFVKMIGYHSTVVRAPDFNLKPRFPAVEEAVKLTSA